ncbi:MAG: SHOCT domain-containing protein [Sphingomicrobium sp.]
MAEHTELVVGHIRRLSELHEAGILTDEEFTAKKAELLERL